MTQVKDTFWGSDLAAFVPESRLFFPWGLCVASAGDPGGEGERQEGRQGTGRAGLWSATYLLSAALLPSASKAETTWGSCHGNCGVLFESKARCKMS